MQPTYTSSAKRMAIAAGAILFACAIVPMPALSQNRSSFEEWAREQGLSAGSAGEDPDGDGFSNLIEYATGTDPLDPTSFPRFSISLLAGVPSLTSPQNSNAMDLTYRLQAKTNISASIPWQLLAERRYPTPWLLDGSVTSLIATNNQLTATIKTGGSNEPQKYFRLQVERPGRGAKIQWTTYEAEQMETTGTVLGPSYTGQNATREASSRRCVRLTGNGQYMQFTAMADANAVVIRYSIPDAPAGGGTNATLSLYVNGIFSRKLPLTSKYAFLYGTYPFVNSPSAGTPRNFWDELRLMPGPILAGDVIRIQKDTNDLASQYLIDLVDLENVPPPSEKPPNFLTVTDYGATPDDGTDDTAAFNRTISAARAQGKGVWIPTGNFTIKGFVNVNNVTVQGAGMWYSNLIGTDDYLSTQRVYVNGQGSNVKLSDFAIIGKLSYRNDSEANDAIGGSFGRGSTIRNIWVEHTKVGAWIVNSDGLLIEGCRFRDTIADGINLCVGMRNTVVRDCTARGTGDDCFAVWPTTYIASTYSPGYNTIKHCTAQLPFLAQGISLYGGESNTVEDCEVIDIPYGAGIYASTTFGTLFGFRGTNVFRRIGITRSGGSDGTIGLVANLINLSGLRYTDIDVVDSATDGIQFISLNNKSISNTFFEWITIVNPGRSGVGYGIVERSGAVGSATISYTSVVNPRTGGWQDSAPAFNLIRGPGNSGW